MAFRFRNTIRIAPGIRLNLGKTGVSISGGVRGATVTAGKRGVHGNLSKNASSCQPARADYFRLQPTHNSATGHEEDEYLVSAKVKRSVFEQINFDKLEEVPVKISFRLTMN